jgi:hypothetical protein
MEQTKTRVSKWKIGLATVAIGALLVVPSAGADTEDVTFDIAGGDFAMGLSGGTMESIDTYALDMSTTGSVNVEVSDLRGEDGNWGVSLQASDFEQTDGEGSTPASGLSVSAAGDVDDSDGIEGAVNSLAPGDLSSASPLATGTGAHGAYTWTPLLALEVDDGTPAGTYTSTLTITSDHAPE